jgi:hypothetical protein
MSALTVLAVVAAAGAIGGIFAALLSEDRGFPLPSKVTTGGATIIRPGFLGLIAVGAIAAALSFALYGPLASETIVGGPDQADENIADDDSDDYGLTLAALAGACLVGMGGSKWLSSQVDAAILQVAASTAAAGHSDTNKAVSIATANPTRALGIARSMGPERHDVENNPPKP